MLVLWVMRIKSERVCECLFLEPSFKRARVVFMDMYRENYLRIDWLEMLENLAIISIWSQRSFGEADSVRTFGCWASVNCFSVYEFIWL